MNLYEGLKIAWRGLIANKIRSALTMLGIIIGVGSVVAMISIGAGANQSVTGRIQGLGSNLLTVIAGSSGSSGGVHQAAGTAASLTLDDAKAIEKNMPTLIKNVSPEYNSQSQVVYLNQNINTQINGVTEKYQAVHNFKAKYGSYISEADVNAQSRVAVLGQEVVNNLFAGRDPIGKTIKIKNIPFRVIGVMEYKGGSGFRNPDDVIFIPLTTAQKRVFGGNNLRSISIEVSQKNLMATASAQITNLLLNRHKITDPNAADFQIFNQADLLSTLNQVTRTLTLLLGGIAGISLLVGGIGIMNIMLVSVTERTREIGLRKAVGAKRRDILTQFLIEAIVLSLIGGGLGLVLGITGSRIIASIAGWPTVVSLNSIWLAFFFSAGIGIVFGVFPARRASMLSPIDALRYE